MMTHGLANVKIDITWYKIFYTIWILYNVNLPGNSAF